MGDEEVRKKLLDSLFFLTRLILNARPHGFTGANITGKRGIGKSAFALKVAYQIGRYDGLSKDAAWRFAINSCIFSLEDIIRVLKKYNYKKRAKIIIWDDAAVHGLGMSYSFKAKEFALLHGLTDTIRTSTEAFILTCPDTAALIKFLRRYDDYHVIVSKNVDWERMAIGYQKYKLATGVMRERRYWKDPFSCYIPNNKPTYFYDKYMVQRDKYKDEVIKDLDKRIKDKRGKELIESLR